MSWAIGIRRFYRSLSERHRAGRPSPAQTRKNLARLQKIRLYNAALDTLKAKFGQVAKEFNADSQASLRADGRRGTLLG